MDLLVTLLHKIKFHLLISKYLECAMNMGKMSIILLLLQWNRLFKIASSQVVDEKCVLRAATYLCAKKCPCCMDSHIFSVNLGNLFQTVRNVFFLK